MPEEFAKVSKPIIEVPYDVSSLLEEDASLIEMVKDQLADYCKSNLAVGNNKDARVEELTLNGTTVHYKIWIRSKDKSYGITVYSVTYTIEGDFDLSNPASAIGAKVCVDTPIGQLCVSAEQIVTILQGVLPIIP
ncbi:hypothetical protein ACP8H3_08880 [Bacillus velezensis]|uniref:hypothetical protein n=1 Tax=Bacillus velezensis TaxID=492670 RepID=UPI003CF4FCE5